MLASSIQPGFRGPHPVFDSGGQLFGPAVDRLGLDADGPGGGTGRPTQEGDGCTFVHEPLNHAFARGASIVYGPFRKVTFMEFGERLTIALAEADESRDGLAKALGISVQAISQVITGVTKAMNAENTLKAARHLGVSAYWLATGLETAKGTHALRESLSDEAILQAAQYDQMSPDEQEQFRMLLAVALRGRKHLGGMSNFDELQG